MSLHGWLQIAVLFGAVLAAAPPLGAYLYRVFEGAERPFPSSLGRMERLALRFGGISISRGEREGEQGWPAYLGSLLLFNLFGFGVLFLLLRLQDVLPLNPQEMTAVPGGLAFNIASSFTTNTNWQSYEGEQVLGNLAQMLGLTWQNFASAASGITVAIALCRGLTRRPEEGAATLGNFWVDLVRALVYVLLPLSVAAAIFFVSQGVVQTLSPWVEAATLEGARQLVPLGPVASQEAIKLLGTNGGGFYGANGAHPFENPTPLSDFVQTFLILLVPAGLVFFYGEIARDRKQAWALVAAIGFFALAGAAIAYSAESGGNPALQGLDLDQRAGNLEGKEVRFGVAASALFATVTTATSCGGTNSMHESFNPIGGMVPMMLMQLGEVVFGGVGTGLVGLLLFALLTVFLAGLMVGRTPEFLGKKVEARELKLIVLYLLVFPVFVLISTGWAAQNPIALASVENQGPHGLSELLYAYTSANANNGSAFSGLHADTSWFELTTGISMLAGRYLPIAATLAIAGSMAPKKRVPPSLGTFPTDGMLFAGVLAAVIVIVGGLTFFPALSLGPLLEHFVAGAGRLF